MDFLAFTAQSNFPILTEPKDCTTERAVHGQKNPQKYIQRYSPRIDGGPVAAQENDRFQVSKALRVNSQHESTHENIKHTGERCPPIHPLYGNRLRRGVAASTTSPIEPARAPLRSHEEDVDSRQLIPSRIASRRRWWERRRRQECLS